MKLYHEIVLDHYHNPRSRGRLKKCDFSSGQHNPSCGDNIVFDGRVENGIITELGFEGTGCVISQAVASMLAESCVGKPLEHLMSLDCNSLASMLHMELGPTRAKCALLPLAALQQGAMMHTSGATASDPKKDLPGNDGNNV
jgi:nitrogen fixation NifU-like protein